MVFYLIATNSYFFDPYLNHMLKKYLTPMKKNTYQINKHYFYLSIKIYELRYIEYITPLYLLNYI